MVIMASPKTINRMRHLNIEASLETEKMRPTHNLVIDANDLLRIRSKICHLYPDKKVIVAPCLSKLYMSREQKVIDSDGKTSPDWYFFSTGVISIIYDSKCDDLTIALFEQISIRLLWCLKWAEYITCELPTSNFHILNTKADFISQHVGVLYENKDVADLIFNAIKLLSENITQKCHACAHNRKCLETGETGKHASKTRILRSLSFNSRQLKQKTNEVDEHNEDIRKSTKTKQKSSLRDSWRRKTIGWSHKKLDSPSLERRPKMNQRSATVIGSLSRDQDKLVDIQCDTIQNNKYNGYQSSPETSAKTSDKSSVHRKLITNLSRANSFRHAIQNNSSFGNNTEDIKPATNIRNGETESNRKAVLERKASGESTDSKDSIIISLFKKRRISRSQSLKSVNRKRDSQASQISQSEIIDTEVPTDSKQYQRITKLVKPRSSTDSLLLRSETMKSVIETGHVARYARERKQWAKTLQKNELQSTDLCVTEL